MSAWSEISPQNTKKKSTQENPRVPADKLSSDESIYTIKLRSAGYRLAYEVVDDELFVYVLSVGKREKDKVHSSRKKRT